MAMKPMNSLPPEDERLAAELRRALRQSEALAPDVAAQLRAARARALDATPLRRPWRWALPAAAMAVLVAALWLPLRPPATSSAPAASGAADAVEVLTDEQSPDFYQDLELYEWLEQEGPHA